MIQKGSVQIYRVLNNKRAVLDVLREGEIFGEMGVITKGERNADAEAMGYVELVVLTDKVVSGLLGQCPKTVQYLMHLLVKRLRRIDQLVKEQTYTNPFMSVCNIFHLLYRDYLAAAKAEGKACSCLMGLKLSEVTARIKDIVLITQSEIDLVFAKLEHFEHVASTPAPSAGPVKDRFLRLTDPDNFLKFAQKLSQELEKNDEFFGTRVQEYMDIADFARHVGSSPDIIYQKMAAGQIPSSIFGLNTRNATAWAEQVGLDFFKAFKPKRKRIEDIETLDDIVHVDGATLRDAFAKLGYYKLGVLLAMAGEGAVKQRILANLSRKIADVVESEGAAGRDLDPIEAEQVEVELIAAIKTIKGIKGAAA
jgi:CRP-like cAMP-binding protein